MTAPDGIVVLRTARADQFSTKTLRRNSAGVWSVARDFDNARRFIAYERPVASLDDLAAVLKDIAGDPRQCVIRGALKPGFEKLARHRDGIARRVHDRQGEPAAFESRARRWVGLDLDSFSLPEFVDPIRDIEFVIDAAVELLPREFADASFYWQLTSSHGVKAGGRVRLWFWLDRPTADRELKAWLAATPCDPAVFAAVQPIFVAAPMLPHGVADFLPVRCGLRVGGVDHVAVPAAVELAAPRHASGAAVGGGFVAGVAEALDRMGDPPHFGGGLGFYAPTKAALTAAFRDGAVVDTTALISQIAAAIDARGAGRPAEYLDERKRDLGRWTLWYRRRAEERAAADREAKPHYRRATMPGDVASRRLRWAVGAFLGRVERRLDANDWIAAEAARLRPGVEYDLQARLTARLLAQGMAPQAALDVAQVRAARAAPGVAKRRAGRAAVPRWGVRRELPRLQIKGAASLGKTRAFIDEYLARPGLWSRNVNFFTKTIKLGSDLAQDMRDALAKMTFPDARRPRIVEIQGRNKDNCHPERIPIIDAALAAKAPSIYRAVCHRPGFGSVSESWCPFFAGCQKPGRYLAQFDSEPALRIMPHKRLTLAQPDEIALPGADLTIVDEGALDDFRTEGEIDPAALIGPGNYSAALGAEIEIQDALDVGAAVAAAVPHPDAVERLRAAGVLPASLRAAAGAAGLAADHAALRLWPGMAPAEAVRRAKAHGRHPGGAVATLYRQLARDLERGRAASTAVEWDAAHTATAESGAKVSHPLIRAFGLLPAVAVQSQGALMLLDADANLAINRRLFGRLRGYTIGAERRAYVTQIYDATLAVSSLTDDVANNQENARRLRGRIAALIRREAAGGKRVLVVAAKKVRLAFTGERDTKTLPHDVEFEGATLTHWGRHLGVNDYADFDGVVIIGRLQLRAEVAERLARAIWGDDPDALLDLPGAYTTELRRHDMRHSDAQPRRVSVAVHRDARVQSLVERVREQGMGQAIDRLRLIHGRPGRRVIVLSNLPVPGLVIDELVSLDDALEGGTVWQRALRIMPAGVVPLSAKFLISHMPALFPSERTAERAIQLVAPPLRNRSTYCEVAELEVAGSRRHFHALVRVGTSLREARAEAERLLAPLAEFRWAGPEHPAATARRLARDLVEAEPAFLAGVALRRQREQLAAPPASPPAPEPTRPPEPARARPSEPTPAPPPDEPFELDDYLGGFELPDIEPLPGDAFPAFEPLPDIEPFERLLAAPGQSDLFGSAPRPSLDGVIWMGGAAPERVRVALRLAQLDHTQAALARRCGVSRTALANLAAGRFGASAAVALRIMAGLRRPVAAADACPHPAFLPPPCQPPVRPG